MTKILRILEHAAFFHSLLNFTENLFILKKMYIYYRYRWIAMKLTNQELATMYIKYKKQLKYFKQRQSLYDLNKYIESKKCLSIIKMEMKKRGLKKKEAKKLSNY